jgi:hypothetical protein
MLGEKSLNKYARVGEIYVGTLGPDSALFTTTQLRLKSQSILLNHATNLPLTHTLTPELSHYMQLHGTFMDAESPFFTLSPL